MGERENAENEAVKGDGRPAEAGALLAAEADTVPLVDRLDSLERRVAELEARRTSS